MANVNRAGLASTALSAFEKMINSIFCPIALWIGTWIGGRVELNVSDVWSLRASDVLNGQLGVSEYADAERCSGLNVKYLEPQRLRVRDLSGQALLKELMTRPLSIIFNVLRNVDDASHLVKIRIVSIMSEQKAKLRRSSRVAAREAEANKEGCADGNQKTKAKKQAKRKKLSKQKHKKSSDKGSTEASARKRKTLSGKGSKKKRSKARAKKAKDEDQYEA